MVFPRFEIFKSDKNHQFYFRLRALHNGENILYSEGYETKQGCQSGVQSVKVNSQYDSNYERRDGILNYTFNLKALNGQIIGRSENYSTKFNREMGIEAVKRDAPYAPIVDLT